MRSIKHRAIVVVTGILTLLAAFVVPAGTASADATYTETVGGLSNTWTNPANAGGSAGPQIAAYTSVQIACKLPGFAVQDGNTWWYQIASSPWSYAYYVSADAFYNNGATSGSLHNTPYVDPAVPDCASGSGTNETAGGLANTWTNYTNAGGAAGPQVASGQTIQIACKLTGFAVQNGNTWWYRIASAPWNNGFYVSADAFYNNGATSGSLLNTPYVDPAVPDCAGSGGGSTANPVATLAQGPAAPAGYRYAISLSGFAPNTSISISCFDSVSPGGFYQPFTLTTDGSGAAFTQSYCYSGDGPDHWVVAGGRFESNHVSWSGSSSGGGDGSTGSGGPTGGGAPSPISGPPTAAISTPTFSGEPTMKANSRVDGSPKSLALLASFKALVASCRAPYDLESWTECRLMGRHYLDKTGNDFYIPLSDYLNDQPGYAGQIGKAVNSKLVALVAAGRASDSTQPSVQSFTLVVGGRATLNTGWFWAIGRTNVFVRGDVWFGQADASGKRPVQIRYKSFIQDTYNFNIGSAYAAYRSLISQGRASPFKVLGQTATTTVSTDSLSIIPSDLGYRWH